MKKLNLPLLLTLGIGSLVAVVGVHYLHGYQVSRSAESLLARADQAAAAGDVDEQIRLLSRYLRHREDDVKTLTKLLKVMREEAFELAENRDFQMLGRVLDRLEKAVRKHPDDVDLRREAYQVMFAVGRSSDAVDHLAELDAMGALTSDDRVSWARGLWLTGKQEEGMKMLAEMVGFDLETLTFDAAKATAADQYRAYDYLAQIYTADKVRNDDFTVPLMILDQGVAANPDKYEPYVVRANFIQQHLDSEADKQKATADIRKAIELSEEDPGVLLMAVRSALSVRDFTWAESLLARGLEKYPDNLGMYASKADVCRAQDKTEEALEWIQKGLAKSQLNGELLYKRVNFEIELKRLDDANLTLQRLADRRFDTVRLELVRARLAMANSDYVDARRRLERLRPLATPGSPLESVIRQSLITVYQQLGMHDMIPGLTGGKNKPDAQSQLLAGDQLARLGRLEEAIAIYQQILTNDSESSDPRDKLTDEGRELVFKKILSLSIERERRRAPEARDWTQVDKMADVLLKRPDLQDFERELFQIDLLVQKESLEEARRRAERAALAFPRAPQFQLMLAELTPDGEQATKILDQVEQTFGDSMNLRMVRANRIAKDGGAEVADKLAALLTGMEKLKIEEQSQMRQLVGGLYRRLGEPARALEIYKQLIKDNPKNLGLLLSAFDLAYASDNLAEMDEALTNIATLSSRDSAEWQACEANRQLWMIKHGEAGAKSLSDVIVLLENARTKRPEYGPFYMSLAEAQLLNGQTDAAIESMQAAVQRRPGEMSYVQRLVDTMRANGRANEAQEYAKLLPTTEKRATDIAMEIDALMAEDPAAALKLAKESFPADTTDPDVLMFLAQVHQAVNQPTESLPYLERALKAAETQPRPWLMYIRTLVAMGRDKEARDAMETARTKVDAKAQPLMLGQSLTALRDYGAAEAEFQKGLQQTPNDTIILRNLALLYAGTQQNDKYISTLDRMIALEANQDDRETLGNIRWARRMRAEQMAASGVYSDFNAAIELLQKNTGDNGELVGDDLLTWLRLHAYRPDTDAQNKAIARLNQIRERRPLTSSESAVLAYVYYHQGRWSEARSLMVNVLSKNPGNIGYITTYINWLIEREEFSDASAWVRQLNPNTLEYVRFSCLLMVKNNKSGEAAKELMKYVPSKIDVPTAAMIMEELGKYDPRFYKAAKQQWQKFTSENPQQIHRYIEYLTRMPKAEGMQDALTLVQEPFREAVQEKRGDVVQYYLNVLLKGLRAHKKESAAAPCYAQIQQLLAQAAQGGVDGTLLAWSEIDYHDIRMDYDKLQSLYEDFLKRPELTDLQRAVIRNNLAFVYAISNEGDKALQVIGDAISQLGPRSDFLDTRGLAYLASGKQEAALKDLRDAVGGGQGTAATYFHLALAEHRSQNVTEAVEALQKAIDLGLTEADLSKPEIVLFNRLKQELGPQLKAIQLSEST